MDYIKDKLEEEDKIVVDPYQSLNDDITIKSKALEDIIANQQAEENRIKDDYDSLGSSANRFLQVFGAGLRGENASNVAQSLRNDLNTRLQNAQSRYKDQRDSAYNQYKDLLARREALEKDKYQKERDQVKDQQFKEQLDYTKDKDNRLYNLELQKLQDVKNAQAQKDKQAVQDLNTQLQQEEKDYYNLENLAQFSQNEKYYDKLYNNPKALEGEIYLFNKAMAKSAGVKEENQDNWIKTNSSLPQPKDTFGTMKKKVNDLLRQQPASDRIIKERTWNELSVMLDESKPGQRVTLSNKEYIVVNGDKGDKQLYDPVNNKMYEVDRTNRTFNNIPIPSFK